MTMRQMPSPMASLTHSPRRTDLGKHLRMHWPRGSQQRVPAWSASVLVLVLASAWVSESQSAWVSGWVSGWESAWVSGWVSVSVSAPALARAAGLVLKA